MILVVPFKYYILPKRTHGSRMGFREFRCVIVEKRANLKVHPMVSIFSMFSSQLGNFVKF